MKNANIQILRGIAIIAVVMQHTFDDGILEVLLKPFINFSVPLFLFLSGYLTKIVLEKKFSFKKRLVKIIIPYVIWSLLYYIMNNKFDFKDLPYQLLTGQACTIYYYILVYVQFVLLTPLIFKLAKSKYKFIFLWITPSAIFVQYIFIFNSNTITFPWNANNFLVWFIYYYIGILIGNKIVTVKFSNKMVLLYFLTIFINMFESFLWYQYGNYSVAISQIKLSNIMSATMTIILFVFFIESNNKYSLSVTKVFSLLNLFGNYSFGIYLCHKMVIFILSYVGVYNKLFFPLNTIFVLILSVSIVFIGKKILGEKFSCYFGF